MKRYLFRGATALVLGGFIAACSHDDIDYSSIVDGKLKAYQEVFVDAYGKIDPNQNWGFGTVAGVNSSRLTRATMPDAPTFRDKNPIVRPTMPSYSNTLPTDAKYAKDYQNYQEGDVIYINAEYSSLNNPQNTDNLTIYADGNVTYDGATNQNGNGTKICVTQGSTLVLKQVYNNLAVYLAPNATLDLTQVNGTATFQNSNAAIFLNSGSQVKAGSLKFTGSTKVLNAGGTITATELTLDEGNTLWNEGTVSVTNALTCSNTGDFVYNAGGKTITAGRVDLINNDALLYNNGTVTVDDEIKLHNSIAEIVNNGTLSGAALNMAAGGKMHNVGTTTISGKTDLTNSNSQWQNDGQYTSGSFDIDNYSKRNYNNCRLTVNGNFFLNRGEFVLNADASVVTNSFTWVNTSNFWMNSRSLVKIAETLLTQNYDVDYGFRGVGDEYAVIQARAIEHEGNEQFRMSYFGNLYVDAGTHFEQWYKDGPSNTNQPCYYYESSVKFSFSDANDIKVTASTAPLSIPASSCSPGYVGKEVEEESWGEWKRIICEDLSVTQRTDFDFNDVVFDARINMAKTKAQILLKAAGGTLPLTVGWSGAAGTSYSEYEVHNLYKVATNVMVNTHAKNGVDGKADVEKTLYGNFNNYNDIKIMVQKRGEWIEITAHEGEPASKILVNTTYQWCDERENISDVYNGTKFARSFTDYVNDPSVASDWYE
jgi:hypothetical protein